MGSSSRSKRVYYKCHYSLSHSAQAQSRAGSPLHASPQVARNLAIRRGSNAVTVRMARQSDCQSTPIKRTAHNQAFLRLLPINPSSSSICNAWSSFNHPWSASRGGGGGENSPIYRREMQRMMAISSTAAAAADEEANKFRSPQAH